MRGEQAVEGVSRPTEVEREAEPRGGRRVVERDPCVLRQIRNREAGAEIDAARLQQELELEDARGRHVEPREMIQWSSAPVSAMQPDERVRIEEDQRFRFEAAAPLRRAN